MIISTSTEFLVDQQKDIIYITLKFWVKYVENLRFSLWEDSILLLFGEVARLVGS